VGGLALGDRDDTAGSATSSSEGSTNHLVDAVDSGIDLAGQTTAAITLALNLDTEIRLDMAEWSGGLQVDGVPSNLQVGVACGIGVGTSGVWGPVADRVLRGTPDTSLLGSDTWGVDVVMGSSGAPVGHARHSQVFKLANQGRDKHGLVSGQHGLTERHGLVSLVMSLHRALSILTVVTLRERLLNLSALVTVQTTVLNTVSYDYITEVTK
jgi:hypothetical protein